MKDSEFLKVNGVKMSVIKELTLFDFDESAHNITQKNITQKKNSKWALEVMTKTTHNPHENDK